MVDLGSKQGIQDICAEQGGGDASSCEAHVVEILFLQNPIQLTFALVVQWLPFTFCQSDVVERS